MKQFRFNAVMLAAMAFALGAAAQEPDSPQPTPPADDQPAQEEMVIPVPVTPDTNDAAAPATGNDNQPADEGPAHAGESFSKQGTTSPRYVAPMRHGTNSVSTVDTRSLSATPTPPDKVVKDGEKGLRFDFRNAPLDLVLSYLSDAAGFIIIPETDIRTKVTLLSSQPVTKEESIDLLNGVLAKDGYAVLRDGRTLTIVTQAEAKRRNETPVKYGYDAAKVPKDQQVVTQIIPVRFIGAVQLAKDLQPLMPAQTTLTANEGGNALVITDTQQNIHRLMEIITALDTTVSSLSSVKVFALRYADAKTVADMVKEVFTSNDSSRSGNGGNRGGFRFGGFNPFGGGGPGGGGDSTSNNGGRPGASKVVATADDRSNSLVVSAPDDLMPTIEQLVKSVDTDVDDLTEIRVFRLMNADPQETSDLLGTLFPDPTASQNNQRNGFGGFFRGPFGGGNDTASTSTPSDRMKKQTKVISVADKRTGSIVVTAARDTMEQIAKMIAQLDSDPARKTKVFVYEVQNTDPTTVQQTLEDLFSGQSTTSSRSRTTTGQAGSQLNTRAQQQNQNGGTSRTSTSGFGNSTGSGATRGFGN